LPQIKKNELEGKIRVGAVNYLNTKPLIYALEHGAMKKEVDLVVDYPSNIAALLLDDKIDVGLVPVTIIPELQEHHIISDYCIGCDGEVASVCLFSDVPLINIKTVLMDYQSRSSVQLLKILMRDYWKITPDIVQTTGEYQSSIKGTTAALIIGDRALNQRKSFAYVYDLGFEWKKFTGLPFVFAAWISNKKLPESFVHSFNLTIEEGFKHLEEIVSSEKFTGYDMTHYFTNNIDYNFTKEKKEALGLFLRLL
jgi:chorismate dehydratase